MSPQIDQIKSTEEVLEQSISEDQSDDVGNVQKYLLSLLFIQWFVFVITLAFGIYSIVVENTMEVSNAFESLLPIGLLVLYYSFGLLITYKRHQLGLLIFAFIGVVLFIIVCLLLGYILLAIIALDIGFGGTKQAFEFIAFFVILFLVIAIIAILTLKFTFDLARLIRRNDYSTV